MPKYGFGVVCDVSSGAQEGQMVGVLTALQGLVEGRDQQADGTFARWVLKGVTVPSTDKEGNPIPGGIGVDAGACVVFRSTTPRARWSTVLTATLTRLPMATSVELGDAANDANYEQHLKECLQAGGCEKWWGPLDRQSAIPAAPVPLGNFVDL